MSKFLILLIGLYSGLLFADDATKVLADFDPRVDVVSANYHAGPYLLYDCIEGHWTCVLESFYKECEEMRAEDLYAKKLEARCAPLEILPTKKSCFQRQLFLSSNNVGTKFCVLPGWKEKEIIFENQN